MLPFLRQVIQRKHCRDGSNRHPGAAIDALHGINVELRDLIETRASVATRGFLRVNAITWQASTYATSWAQCRAWRWH